MITHKEGLKESMSSFFQSSIDLLIDSEVDLLVCVQASLKQWAARQCFGGIKSQRKVVFF